MSVYITDLCINCDACIEECPATAIVSADESPLADGEYTYVKPEKCIECVDTTVPKCADVCPTEGCIVWDMPYIPDYDEYYIQGQEAGKYLIRTHKKKGLLSPANQPRPFRDSISLTQRAESMAVEV
ncbi:4Fe-4S dicluster domain-containing protein [Sulfurimonas marina]|uniref:4Fe-4S dicluster domain-containing protein n=1 Tax=Sulfurimonas marina TaxID=2590551 RepID=A0A7M1ATK2_9BACT|nr:4Fe-4S dicluster domain-containing protein [Sulfurimonas marina]QOP40755.1 4Fe-4S dicluster domain-containing protein [Sulfurimonas marina]